MDTIGVQILNSPEDDYSLAESTEEIQNTG